MEPGSYPRVNAAMMNSGQYNEAIVSLAGKFVNNGGMCQQQQYDTESTTHQFQTADQGIVQVEFSDGFNIDPTSINYTNGSVYEIIGEVISTNQLVGFVARMLSVDMDLGVYNRVIQIQRNPKYAHYFESAENRMVTN